MSSEGNKDNTDLKKKGSAEGGSRGERADSDDSGGSKGSTDSEKKIAELEAEVAGLKKETAGLKEALGHVVDTLGAMQAAERKRSSPDRGAPSASGSGKSTDPKIIYTDKGTEFVLKMQNGAGVPVEGKIRTIKGFLASKDIGVIANWTEDDKCLPAGTKVNRHDATLTIPKASLKPDQLDKITSSERVIDESKGLSKS